MQLGAGHFGGWGGETVTTRPAEREAPEAHQGDAAPLPTAPVRQDEARSAGWDEAASRTYRCSGKEAAQLGLEAPHSPGRLGAQAQVQVPLRGAADKQRQTVLHGGGTALGPR